MLLAHNKCCMGKSLSIYLISHIEIKQSAWQKMVLWGRCVGQQSQRFWYMLMIDRINSIALLQKKQRTKKRVSQTRRYAVGRRGVVTVVGVCKMLIHQLANHAPHSFLACDQWVKPFKHLLSRSSLPLFPFTSLSLLCLSTISAYRLPTFLFHSTIHIPSQLSLSLSPRHLWSITIFKVHTKPISSRLFAFETLGNVVIWNVQTNVMQV